MPVWECAWNETKSAIGCAQGEKKSIPKQTSAPLEPLPPTVVRG